MFVLLFYVLPYKGDVLHRFILRLVQEWAIDRLINRRLIKALSLHVFSIFVFYHFIFEFCIEYGRKV